LRAAVQELGPERITFSLDLKAGRLLGDASAWGTDAANEGSVPNYNSAPRLRVGLQCGAPCGPEPLEIALHAVECGVTSLIVLDLAGVGEGQGVPTIPLCRQLRAQCGDLEIITGGGVRHADDLAELAAAGVDGVLVASALHDGALSADDLQRYV
jgi:phosphoribosylformimino-5-aminoimidazole carboxamide ribotide isomerase